MRQTYSRTRWRAAPETRTSTRVVPRPRKPLPVRILKLVTLPFRLLPSWLVWFSLGAMLSALMTATTEPRLGILELKALQLLDEGALLPPTPDSDGRMPVPDQDTVVLLRAAASAAHLSAALFSRAIEPTARALIPAMQSGLSLAATSVVTVSRHIVDIVRNSPPEALAGVALLGFALWVRKPVQRFLTRARLALGRSYAAFLSGLRAKSRLAAALFPHALLVGACIAAHQRLPPWALSAVLGEWPRRALLAVLPGAASASALRTLAAEEADLFAASDGPRSPGSRAPATKRVEAWLAYWVAVTPLLVVMQTPLTFAALRFVSGWRELSLLYVLWLMLPLTSGAAIVTRAATSRAAGISAWLRQKQAFVAANRLAVMLKIATGPLLKKLVPTAAADPLLLASVALLILPGFITVHGTVYAGLVSPAVRTVVALTPPTRSDAPAAAAETTQRRRELLTYWAVYAFAAGVVAPLFSTGPWRRMPLRQHVALCAVLWLQLLGGTRWVVAWARGKWELVRAALADLLGEYNAAVEEVSTRGGGAAGAGAGTGFADGNGSHRGNGADSEPPSPMSMIGEAAEEQGEASPSPPPRGAGQNGQEGPAGSDAAGGLAASPIANGHPPGGKRQSGGQLGGGGGAVGGGGGGESSSRRNTSSGAGGSSKGLGAAGESKKGK